jgi:hypothetical protein
MLSTPLVNMMRICLWMEELEKLIAKEEKAGRQESLQGWESERCSRSSLP